jgi:hypothetical protein
LATAGAAGADVINPALTYDNAMLNSSIERSYAGTGAIVKVCYCFQLLKIEENAASVVAGWHCGSGE